MCCDLVYAFICLSFCRLKFLFVLQHKHLERGLYFLTYFGKILSCWVTGEVPKLKVKGKYPEVKMGAVENLCFSCILFLSCPPWLNGMWCIS